MLHPNYHELFYKVPEYISVLCSDHFDFKNLTILIQKPIHWEHSCDLIKYELCCNRLAIHS